MALSSAADAHGYLPQKPELLKRLARIEGQVRGIARMVDEERYCIEILTQLAAVGTALEAVGLKVLDEHVKHCVTRALTSGDPKEAEAKTSELLEAVQRFAKTR
jgi:DNA-binding FrmR family transcriptional regulator